MRYFLLIIIFFVNLLAKDIKDTSLEDLMSMETELTADVGSRNGAENLLKSRAPTDVITAKQIQHSGLTSLTDILRYFIAGFNAPNTSVADGSDHVRAFTLRGMSPDQILVLINGKRVHTSALLHVNGTIGRGSSNVDLDTIAPVAIEKIEILRDGAAAQYGSDAISGVINIILKGNGYQNSFSIHAGKRKKGDGENIQAETFISTPLEYEGFVNLSIQIKNQNQTNRAGRDVRLTPQAVTTHAGIPDAKNLLAILNMELPQENNLNIYVNSIFNYRDSKASAFFRPSNDNVQTSTIYPNGFLPILEAKIIDYSLTAGIKNELSNGFHFDVSNVYGIDKIDYYLDNSMNYSLGSSSPTSFYNGGLEFIQNTTNLDLKKEYNSFNIAMGLEFRDEIYKIKEGELNSYINDGSQGFPGYSDKSAVDATRDSYATYLDMVYNHSDNFSLEGATRYEHFSNFGDTINIKLATSYKIEEIVLRASASTGFRAPSLAQSNYSNIATFAGKTSGTFTPDAPISKELGAKDLKPEKSKHFAIGSVYQITKESSLMIDYFYIYVKDKILLSQQYSLTPAQVSKYGVTNASFFTNSVDTMTQGVDIKYNNKIAFDQGSFLNLGIWYNYNRNKVVRFNDTEISNSYEQINQIENGQPKESAKILVSYETDNTNLTFNLNRYGSYSQVKNEVAYNFDAAWTLDVDLSYNITKSVSLSIGGNNVLDTTPNKWDGLIATSASAYYGYNGIKPYSRYSPFGYSGAYYYTRVSIRF